jgi:hypothetical protein
MKLLSRALAGQARYHIPSLAIPDQDLRTIRSKVKTPGDMAEASPARILLSLMPSASDRSQPGPVNSHDPRASRQSRLWFYARGSPRQPPTTMSNSKCHKHTCQQRALSPRPKGRARRASLVATGRLREPRERPGKLHIDGRPLSAEEIDAPPSVWRTRFINSEGTRGSRH